MESYTFLAAQHGCGDALDRICAHVHELHSALSEALAEARVDRRKTTGRRYATKKGNTAKGLSSLPFRAFATSNVEAGRLERADDIRLASVS